MKYISIKYIGSHAKRTMNIDMGGFELEATSKYDNGRDVIRVGQICKDFKLSIPPDGKCKVPDTEFNRGILRLHCSPRTEKVHGIKTNYPATYDLLSDIDLKEDAPDKPDMTYTQEQLDAIVAEQVKAATKKSAPKAPASEKSTSKKTVKKTETKDPRFDKKEEAPELTK